MFWLVALLGEIVAKRDSVDPTVIEADILFKDTPVTGTFVCTVPDVTDELSNLFNPALIIIEG